MNLTTQELLSMLPPDRQEAVRAQLGTTAAPKREQAGRGVNRMNGLERRYAAHLDTLAKGGTVKWWKFNAKKLLIADGEKEAWYKPDFCVVFSHGGLEEYHETKGFWREAARVRIKVAAGIYPNPFVAVRWKDGAWDYERFGGRSQ